MKVLIPGYRYELENVENKSTIGQIIQLRQKGPTGTSSTQLQVVADGTSPEELIDVLVERLRSTDDKIVHENKAAIEKLEKAIAAIKKPEHKVEEKKPEHKVEEHKPEHKVEHKPEERRIIR